MKSNADNNGKINTMKHALRGISKLMNEAANLKGIDANSPVCAFLVHFQDYARSEVDRLQRSIANLQPGNSNITNTTVSDVVKDVPKKSGKRRGLKPDKRAGDKHQPVTSEPGHRSEVTSSQETSQDNVPATGSTTGQQAL